tara:strand:- start:243 stop:506 length:264 start_codon:yes stop_codon:yes gene_type:complete
MIEKLKELEKEAMDSIDLDTYDDITGDVLDDYKRPIYLCGYIDGLQTAINMLAEESETMSYSIDMGDIFPDDDEDIAQEYPEIYDNE